MNIKKLGVTIFDLESEENIIINRKLNYPKFKSAPEMFTSIEGDLGPVFTVNHYFDKQFVNYLT